MNDALRTASVIRFPLDYLIGHGPVREREFRARMNSLNLEPYRDKAVLIPWIHEMEIPMWVYLMATARLGDVAAVLSFGELCSPITLVQRGRVNTPIDVGNSM